MDTDPIRQGRQFWQEQYEQWQSSNLSKAAFCRKASLKVVNFYYWSNIFAQPTTETDTPERHPAFIPLELTRESVPAFSLQVGDVTLSCDHPVSTNQLRQWLAAIRSSL